jgi:restriction endonuclease Mrr
MVPGFQTLMRPLLAALGDGQMRSLSELRDLVAADLGITAEDRAGADSL